MRLFYIDEAGISDPSQEPFLTVVATILHADNQLAAVENKLRNIVARRIPAEFQDDFVFHAKDIFNGGGKIFGRKAGIFSFSERLEIADELASIPKKLGIPLAAGFIDRIKFRDFLAEAPDSGEQVVFDYDRLSTHEKYVFQHICGYINCAMSIEHWMRDSTKNEICLLVVENNDSAKKFIRDAQNQLQNKSLAKGLDYESIPHFPFRKIKEDPLFQDKKPGNALQLADFCAYVLKSA